MTNLTRPLGRLYMHYDPTDRRIRVVCGWCNTDQVALTDAEAKRDLQAHRKRHETGA